MDTSKILKTIGLGVMLIGLVLIFSSCTQPGDELTTGDELTIGMDYRGDSRY